MRLSQLCLIRRDENPQANVWISWYLLSNGEGGIFHLRRLYKGGYLHDKKHYPPFTGSASYRSSLLCDPNAAYSLQWWVLALSACGQLCANLVSEEHPLLLQMVSCEWLNINILISNKGQWKFVRHHLTFSREGRNLEERLLTLGFFLVFSNQNTFLISILQIPTCWILRMFAALLQKTAQGERGCSTARILSEALQMLKKLEVVRNSGESAVLCLSIWMLQ